MIPQSMVVAVGVLSIGLSCGFFIGRYLEEIAYLSLTILYSVVGVGVMILSFCYPRPTIHQRNLFEKLLNTAERGRLSIQITLREELHTLEDQIFA